MDPEESLFDSISRDAAIEKPLSPGFFVFFYFTVAALLAVFAGAGFRLGVLKGGYFAALSQANQFISIPVASPRGLIYSREGDVLADNQFFEKEIGFDFRASISIDDFRRTYKDNEAYSHLLGYVSPSEKTGRGGVENYYDDLLRGKNGKVLVARFEDKVDFSEPARGQSLVLNIDSSLQEGLYAELNQGLRQAGLRSGAAVALDPRDGRVLALLSLPVFDSNSLSGGLTPDEFRSLSENRSRPFLNRVISGRFSPGSTIKPLIALAALEEGTIAPEKKINAPGLIFIKNPYDPEIVYTFRDWRNHGRVNMREAIAHSSDIYFYTVGGGFYDVPALGIERIARYMKMFRLDSVLGIDLPGEVAGFVPTPEWKRDYRNEIWYQGDTFNVSIGQGDVLTTPLWLTSYIAAIGQGAMYKPYVVDRTVDEEGKAISVARPEVLFDLPFSESDLKVVREGMRLAAEVGTARVLGDLPFKVGAKSGTAEVIKGQSTNSWISVYAPYDNPQIALTIMMESGREGSYIPTQIAYRILKEYFK